MGIRNMGEIKEGGSKRKEGQRKLHNINL